MRLWWLAVCALLLAGCVKRGYSGGSSSSSLTETVKPDWAQVFLQCASSLGKSKDDVVAALGPPKSAGTIGGVDHYDYESPNYSVRLYFSGTLTDVNLILTKKQNAGTVWQALCGSGSAPKSMLFSNQRMDDFWRNGGRNIENWPIALVGEIQPGSTIQLDGRTTTPFLTADRTFSTTTNSYTTGALAPNPAADWRSITIEGISTGKHESEMFVTYGEEHDLPQR